MSMLMPEGELAPLPGQPLHLLHSLWQVCVASLWEEQRQQARRQGQQAEHGGGHGVVEVPLWKWGESRVVRREASEEFLVRRGKGRGRVSEIA